MAAGGRMGLNAGSSVLEGGCSFTFITWATQTHPHTQKYTYVLPNNVKMMKQSLECSAPLSFTELYIKFQLIFLAVPPTTVFIHSQCSQFRFQPQQLFQTQKTHCTLSAQH